MERLPCRPVKPEAVGSNPIGFAILFLLVYCGSSSVVEHRLPKPGVEGSNPFSRSIVYCERSEYGISSAAKCSISILATVREL